MAHSKDMDIKTIEKNGIIIAVVNSGETVLCDTPSALDFMMSISYETGCRAIVLNKECVCEKFFDLRTKTAGDILQKFINYDIKLALTGDFSGYTSKALRDFIYESNNGSHIFFTASEEEAVERILGC